MTTAYFGIVYTMEYFELGFCFVIGLVVMLLVAYTLRLKRRGVVLLLLNSLIAAGVIAVLSVSKLLYFPLSPFSAIMCGILGLPGAVTIIIFTLFLG